eukprot:3695690-Amphidinium_carterae.1
MLQQMGGVREEVTSMKDGMRNLQTTVTFYTKDLDEIRARLVRLEDERSRPSYGHPPGLSTSSVPSEEDNDEMVDSTKGDHREGKLVLPADPAKNIWIGPSKPIEQRRLDNQVNVTVQAVKREMELYLDRKLLCVIDCVGGQVQWKASALQASGLPEPSVMEAARVCSTLLRGWSWNLRSGSVDDLSHMVKHANSYNEWSFICAQEGPRLTSTQDVNLDGAVGLCAPSP